MRTIGNESECRLVKKHLKCRTKLVAPIEGRLVATLNGGGRVIMNVSLRGYYVRFSVDGRTVLLT